MYVRLAGAVARVGGDAFAFRARHGSIRFSFSRYNSDADVDRVVEVFPQFVANLRNVSRYWDQEKNCPRPDADELIRPKEKGDKAKRG